MIACLPKLSIEKTVLYNCFLAKNIFHLSWIFPLRSSSSIFSCQQTNNSNTWSHYIHTVKPQGVTKVIVKLRKPFMGSTPWFFPKRTTWLVLSYCIKVKNYIHSPTRPQINEHSQNSVFFSCLWCLSLYTSAFHVVSVLALNSMKRETSFLRFADSSEVVSRPEGPNS